MKLDRAISQILTTEQGCRLGQGSAILFLFLALLSLITLLSNWWQDAWLSSNTATRSELLSDLGSPLSDLASRLPQAHLFGYQAPASDYVPITSLQVRLTGIVQMSTQEGDHSQSRAIISVQGGIGKVFQVGDVIMEGIKITDVTPDSVILDNNGHSERLPLQRNRLRGK